MGVILNKCCFSIELKSGCLIIGYLNLISYISFILKLILNLANYKEFREGKVVVQTIGAFTYSELVAMLVISIMCLAFTLILLIGLHKNKRGYVKNYLIYALIFNVLYIIQVFANLGVYGVYTVFHVINIIFGIYFLLVIGSYYQKMDNPANNPAIYNTA